MFCTLRKYFLERSVDIILKASIPKLREKLLEALQAVLAAFVPKEFLSVAFDSGGVGLAYTYLGLVLFLAGANIGFMPAGNYLGQVLAGQSFRWLLVPIGMLIGYFIVKAEPAVYVLNKQVEEVTDGAISAGTMGAALSAGVSLSVGLAMVRVLTGISILWFLIPGYAFAIGISFVVPKLYTAIAFDAGGVASGPMTATFLLPLAQGACVAVGGNIVTDAFLALYEEHGITVSLRTVGAGTAVRETLSTLGLEQTEKAVLFAMITAETWPGLQKDLRRKMRIDVPGTGIAFIIPVSSIGGKRALQFLTEHQTFALKEESTLKDTRKGGALGSHINPAVLMGSNRIGWIFLKFSCIIRIVWEVLL